jgi:repressor LexA
MEGLMMELTDLTPRQSSVLNFIIEYQSEHAIAPSVREITAQLGLRSPSGIHRVLNILREKGYIKAEDARKRAWRYCGKLPGKGISLLGNIATGNPMEAIKLAKQKIDISPGIFGKGNYFALRVHGDSMINAHIVNGDIAVIHIQPKVEQGQIAAVMIQEVLSEATLKIVRRTRHILMLEPANPDYSPMVFKGKARERVKILGKLAGVVRRS